MEMVGLAEQFAFVCGNNNKMKFVISGLVFAYICIYIYVYIYICIVMC